MLLKRTRATPRSAATTDRSSSASKRRQSITGPSLGCRALGWCISKTTPRSGPVLRTGVARAGLRRGQETTAYARITVTSGTWQIDDVYVDPRMR